MMNEWKKERKKEEEGERSAMQSKQAARQNKLDR